MRKFSLLALSLMLVTAIIFGCGHKIVDDGMGNRYGLDMANIDTTCEPCRDFYQYANGGWLAKYEIPQEYSSWSVSREMMERNNVLLKEILEESVAMSNPEKGSSWQMVGDLYFSAMDTARIEKDRAAPLQATLEKINRVSNATELLDLVAEFHSEGNGVMFSVQTEQDLKDNTKYIIYVGQGGLGLPDRDYYTKEDDESVKIRDQYVTHMTNMFVLAGDAAEIAAGKAEAILALETRMAEKSFTKVQMRNPASWYDYMSIADAEKIIPAIDWNNYLTSIGAGGLDSISLTQHDFFTEVNQMLADLSLDDWKAYLTWHTLSSAAPYLSDDFAQEDFAFFSKTLRGTEKLRVRWKRVLSTMNWTIGEALGQIYVHRAFPPATKARAIEMINNVTAALRTRLENLAWMSDETKEKALAKLATFTPKIGYPDKWRDYSGLEIDRDAYVNNLRRARAFEFKRQLDKIGKPVDKTEWGMPPQIVNAYYNPLLNEIVFPAAIMQPPFFDGEIDDAINYGAIGAVIGHEIMHGFDDMGSQFDADGNMTNWWTEEDRAGFEARTQGIIDQFNEFIPIDSLRINGELTQGENIGDLGGLKIAFEGLQIARAGKPDPMVDGFTQEQRFYLSWAQSWRNKSRDENLKLQINTDPHSPAKYRVNGPFQNLATFQKAFGCKDGDNMVATDARRVSIW